MLTASYSHADALTTVSSDSRRSVSSLLREVGNEELERNLASSPHHVTQKTHAKTTTAQSTCSYWTLPSQASLTMLHWTSSWSWPDKTERQDTSCSVHQEQATATQHGSQKQLSQTHKQHDIRDQHAESAADTQHTAWLHFPGDANCQTYQHRRVDQLAHAAEMQRIEQLSPVILYGLCGADVVDGFVATFAAEDMTGGGGGGAQRRGERGTGKKKRGESRT
eukprot:COSAG03_NODE_3118_length_2204_cov_2.988599_1_plen_221_part_10